MRNLIELTQGVSNFTVFAHNFSGFDGKLLFHHLAQYGKVTPLYHNGRLKSVKLSVPKGYKWKFIDGSTKKFNSNFVIEFKDTFLFLPVSLRKLCANFNIITGKGFFPYLLKDIFYRAPLPKFELWSGISLDEYQKIAEKYLNIKWYFKKEAISYCEQDCKALYELVTAFNAFIFNKWSVNITRCVSLPALAMLIYNIHYMPPP